MSCVERVGWGRRLGAVCLEDGIVHINGGDGFVGLERIVAVVEHGVSIISDDWLCLDLKIAYHSVAVPEAHHPDVVEIEVATKHRHGASSAQGACTDLGKRDEVPLGITVSHQGDVDQCKAPYIAAVMGYSNDVHLT
jgi:hypothetical protein